MNSQHALQHQEALSAKVHDLWISVEDIQLDTDRHVISIELRPKPKGRPTAALTIPTARRLHVNDTERIGIYDLNRIELNEDPPRVVLHGNIPLVVTIEVDDPLAAHVIEYDDQS